MKLSLNWLKRYLDITYTPEKIAEMLTLIGLEVEGIEKVESIIGGLAGVLVGHVKACEKHPDADKLSLTKVDIGTGEELQIVCGAPNVAAGQKVMVATIGTTLYDDEGKPWTIKKGKIRGQDSHGMICAEDELGIGQDHSGIIVLPAEAHIGQTAADYYGIEDDYVFEVGLTPNRSDATSQLGIARDLLAYMRVNENYQDDIRDPDTADFITERVALNIDAEVINKKACIRYSGVTINNVSVGESPEWLKKLLRAIGVKPINNIVDITNFVLNELGQPLHAFDADKIKDKKIIVKTLKQGTEFTTLDGSVRKLGEEDLMICDGSSAGLCIAGVYGGQGSGVTQATKNVFLESACFNSKYIRRTSTSHNLRTDAAKIYEKGSDPNITIFAMKRAAGMIRKLAGGAISDKSIDIYPEEVKMAEIRLFFSHVASLTGVVISEDEIYAILQAMEMEITPFDDESVLVRVPTNKSDVLREVDLIEEILRIYGLNRVPVSSQIRSTISYTTRPDKNKTRETISDFLASSGFNEMMGMSLIESRWYEGTDLVDTANLVYINNTSNIQLNILRPDMLMSGLLAVAYNLNRQQSSLALFENGKSYQSKGENGYEEKELISLFLTGKKNEESWLTDAKAEKGFYDIKKSVLAVLARVGIKDFRAEELTGHPGLKYGLGITRGKDQLAVMGEVRKNILQKAGIKVPVFYGEIEFTTLLRNLSDGKMTVSEVSRYPSMRRDLAMVVNSHVKFAEIEEIARKTDRKFLKQISLFDVYQNEKQLGEGKKSYAVSFVFENTERTLQDKEVDHIMDKMISNMESGAGAKIRK